MNDGLDSEQMQVEGVRIFVPKNFRPKLSARCEMNNKLRMMELHCKKNFWFRPKV